MLVAAAALAVSNLSVTLLRSTIPLSIHGSVTALETRLESHPGVDDVHLATISGRTLHIDADVAGHLRIGDLIEKKAWSRTLHTSQGRIRVGPSPDVWGMAITMPLILALVPVLLRRRRSPGPTNGQAPANRRRNGD